MDGYWSYREWVEQTVGKIVRVAHNIPGDQLSGWLDVQVRSAIAQAHRHGQSGLGDDDPVTP
ncbi:hypothetical protein [Phenylobacterium sp.]|uniref:hypothetical protein n=1 Tax=Phenylobacterium sp. TaxID=1871053 RepID=UPI0035B467EA